MDGSKLCLVKKNHFFWNKCIYLLWLSLLRNLWVPLLLNMLQKYWTIYFFLIKNPQWKWYSLLMCRLNNLRCTTYYELKGIELKKTKVAFIWIFFIPSPLLHRIRVKKNRTFCFLISLIIYNISYGFLENIYKDFKKKNDLCKQTAILNLKKKSLMPIIYDNVYFIIYFVLN